MVGVSKCMHLTYKNICYFDHNLNKSKNTFSIMDNRKDPI